MILPTLRSSPNILMTEWTSVCLGSRLPWMTAIRLSMALKVCDKDWFFASFALFVEVLLYTFLQQMKIKRLNLYNLRTSITISKHKTTYNPMKIEFLAIFEFFWNNITELTRYVLNRSLLIRCLGNRSLRLCWWLSWRWLQLLCFLVILWYFLSKLLNNLYIAYVQIFNIPISKIVIYRINHFIG